MRESLKSYNIVLVEIASGFEEFASWIEKLSGTITHHVDELAYECYGIHEKKRRPNYKLGMYALARACGLSDGEDLRHWAGKNPSIWGNEYGLLMFDVRCAYVDKKEILTAKKLAQHFKEVAARARMQYHYVIEYEMRCSERKIT